ncbi:glycoside hydrolase family 2 TIM barrel-domain containing protein [Sphingobacterium sp. SG20118]|uniref:glycoside hydrolase family 2 TIM barrel-domain containing protein n=1 Tax=Sphingobacterium sp. SG20118 TaxID=3367156 RepID=UPI0037DFC09F
MNTDWAFYRGDIRGGEKVNSDDSKWMPAVLPHIMQLEKKHNGGDAIYDGVGWYRRYFKLSDRDRNKRVAIHFEGVMNKCEVFVNGKSVGKNFGGYVGFTLDITDQVMFGDENNVIAVRVSAEYDPLTPPGKPQDRLDFYYYSGIYRDAQLIVSSPLYITDELAPDASKNSGVFVTYPKVDKAQAIVQVHTELKNGEAAAAAGYLLTLIKNEKGKIVGQHRADFILESGRKKLLTGNVKVNNPNLWHPYRPYRYTLESRVYSTDGTELDRRTEHIGIRHIAYTKDGGFFINGEHIYMVGANRHQAYPYVGDAVSNSMQEREVIDMKRGGYNAVRAAHYPHDPAFLEACDKHGLLVVECVPGWQYFNPAPVFTDRLEMITRGMIRRDRNRPSVVLWETALNETTYPLAVVKRIFEAAHEEYPGDQMYTAGDYFSHEETEPYYDVFYKQVSKYPKDGSVMSNYLEDQLAIKPLFTREWGDGVGEKPRVSLVEDEYEQVRQGRGRLDQLNGNGYFDWCMLDANPRMGGHFMWSYNDYTRGAEEETMYSGVVDVNRYPKFAYYMMQSMRANNIHQKGLFKGPMVFVASFNTSEKYKSATSEITVYSNCDEVTLYRNGKKIGTQKRTDRTKVYPFIVSKGGSPSFVFDAGTFEKGELKAIGYVNGKAVAEHVVKTAKEAYQIQVEIPDHQITPIADGSDMIPVYFKICDVNGTVVHDAQTEIHIEVEGEGVLVGDKSLRIGVNPQVVEGGIGFAFIRTSKKSGTIQISASSGGLKSGVIKTKSIKKSQVDLGDGKHQTFTGLEEDNVMTKPTKWDKQLLGKTKVKFASVRTTSEHKDFPVAHVTDGDDYSWWIANTGVFPQVVTLVLEHPTQVLGSRIRFQKDSSKYKHRVEASMDGNNWEVLYEKECTGWDFKPVKQNKLMKFFRVTILESSEGHAGLAEVTLFH